MAYKALYRTYRPLSFSEVAGQKHIVKTLENALKTNKIAHAYLFCGPRGTGKTTMAKLFAKALNCEEGVGHQCNVCGNCLGINDGSHPDVIEIDAASNNGVEDVRDLIEKVKYSPIKGKYKVYIIDEVHMMSASAFNALLKTLEEPPTNVIFILATTEPHKVLPTIISRCQRYDFSKVEDQDIRARMKEILQAEHVEYDEQAIDLIISLADGGVRDALSMLDQVLAYSGNILKEDDILDLFGLAGSFEKRLLLNAIARGDTATVIEKFKAFVENGIDIRRLNSDLLDMLKDVLIYHRTKQPSLLLVLKEDEAIELAEAISLPYCLSMIDILVKTQSDFRLVSNMRSLFEITLLKLTTVSELVSVDELPLPTKKVERVKPTLEKKTETAPLKALSEEKVVEPEPVVAPIIEPVIVKDPEPIHVEEPVVEITPPQASTSPKVAIEVSNPTLAISGDMHHIDEDLMIQIMVSGNRNEKLKLVDNWHQLKAYKLDEKIGHLASLLSDAQPYVLSKEILVLSFYYENAANKVNIKANQAIIQQMVKPLIGRDIFVYALHNKEKVKVERMFRELQQLKRLPDAKNLVINLQGVKS